MRILFLLLCPFVFSCSEHDKPNEAIVLIDAANARLHIAKEQIIEEMDRLLVNRDSRRLPEIAKKVQNAEGDTSVLSEKDIAHLEKNIIKFPGRIKRDDWVGQAKRLSQE